MKWVDAQPISADMVGLQSSEPFARRELVGDAVRLLVAPVKPKQAITAGAGAGPRPAAVRAGAGVDLGEESCWPAGGDFGDGSGFR